MNIELIDGRAYHVEGKLHVAFKSIDYRTPWIHIASSYSLRKLAWNYCRAALFVSVSADGATRWNVEHGPTQRTPLTPSQGDDRQHLEASPFRIPYEM